MPVSITLLTIPSGSQFTSTIASDEDADKNDFTALILTSENGTGLTESNITLSSGTLVSLKGKGVSWEATIRPPETAAAITLTIAADAFTEGNAETSLDIRVSTFFPDADAESPTSLFTHGLSSVRGIAVTPTRILVSQTTPKSLQVYTHSGTHQTGETLTGFTGNPLSQIDTINGDLLVYHFSNESGANRLIRWRADGTTVEEIERYEIFVRGRGVAHTPLGIAQLELDGSNPRIRIQAYGTTDTTEYDLETERLDDFIAHQNDLIYAGNQFSEAFRAYSLWVAEIADADINFLKPLNVDIIFAIADISIYRDTLYLIDDGRGDDDVLTLDIRKYRPLAKNTKTTIYPVFANEGETIPLSQFCPDAKEFTFSVGFDKPTYLSINADNEIAIASNAVTETTPVLVKLTGINYIDSVDFQFYLIIVQTSSPTWRDVESLSMKANTTYNLHPIVDADSIAFEPGETQPTGSSLSDGVFTIATTAGTAYFRATKDGLTTDKAIQIDVIQEPNPDNFSDVFRYKVEIAGVDVTSDYITDSPLRLTKSLDDVELTRYRAHSVTVSLRDIEGKYSPDLAGNFWETNNLNPGGYQEEIKVYRESFISDAWVESLLFVGIIEQQAEQFSAVQVNINAKDISVELERSFISDFGTLSKWASLRQQSDEATFEGVYVPEGSLLPIQPEVAKAWSDSTELTLRRLQLPTKGPPLSNTGYLTPSDFRTSGGFLQTPPLLNAKTLPRSEDVTFLFDQLALTGSVYNTNIQLPEVVLDNPTVFNRGSVPFSVEDTRITRLITDRVHDATNDRLLMLLSNPEGHVADLLVQYDIDGDSYRTLHTFDKGISVHRIARRTSTDYYILSAKAISQDRSAASLPRTTDSTGYAYDSLAEESEIKILRYNASTGTLTEHVDETNTRPPQLGIQYHVGFENAVYIDDFEGIVADYRGSFKWYSGNLYYRYATPSEFGVARVNTSGTTTEMIDQATLNYHNWLNFAFDVTSGGDIYFVYSVGDGDESSLVIKRRTSGGTETTILTDTQDLDALTTLDDAGGAYLGCHEALFHDDALYMLVPIQRVDYDADDDETTRSREKAAGMVLLSCDVTAGTPSLTIIEKWDFATHGACNLIVHDNAVHYTEQPIAASKFLPINSSL